MGGGGGRNRKPDQEGNGGKMGDKRGADLRVGGRGHDRFRC